jgi:hypothetical protein
MKKKILPIKRLDDSIIRKALVTRILEINHCPSYYSKLDNSDIPRPSNLG